MDRREVGRVRNRPTSEDLLADEGWAQAAGKSGIAVAPHHRDHRSLLQDSQRGAMNKVDRDLDNEIDAHLAEAVEDYIARGLSPRDARHAALRDFGGVTQVKQVHREMRSFTFMNWLDFKLAGRMLVKYPGLTVVGGFAMAFAILVGIVIFQFAGLFLYPSLPLANGDRIVALGLRDVAENEEEPKALFDFISWQESLQ